MKLIELLPPQSQHQDSQAAFEVHSIQSQPLEFALTIAGVL
jgi:hypothetical protein